MPSKPSPTTDIPITAPPEKAIERARFMPPSLAAFAVRTFAFVATLIPKYPARVEKIAPIRKQIAVDQLTNPIKRKSAIAKTTRILYSAVKNAKAPS